MFRLPLILFAIFLSLTTPVSAKKQPVVFDTINGYTVIRADRKTCFATIPLLSINGARVSFSLYQKKNGKTWQMVAFNEGSRPKKRKDRISVRFDGGEFYDRKVKLDSDGVFELPHRKKAVGKRFLNKFAGGERMVVLLRDTKDGFALQLTRSSDVLSTLAACAEGG